MATEILDYLSEHIGERVAGSEREARARQFIADRMRDIGLGVETQLFRFTGWEPVKWPTLEVIEPETKKLSPGLVLFSSSTPEGGLTGRVRRFGTIYIVEEIFEWPKYAVVDKEGRPTAYVIGSPETPAICLALMKMGRNWGRAPYVMIGKEDLKQFQQWQERGKEIAVKLEVAGRLVPDLISGNVVGTLKGTSLPEKEIVISAHYDTVYTSPGANDNASGVETIFRVAKELSEIGTKKTVKFVAFGAEEYGFFGSYYFTESLKEQTLLSNVRALINVDMVGAGESLRLYLSPTDFSRKIRARAEESGLRERIQITFGKPARDSDHWPFLEEGIDVAALECWPYDHYHQPTDTKEKIAEQSIEKAVGLVEALVQMLAH